MVLVVFVRVRLILCAAFMTTMTMMKLTKLTTTMPTTPAVVQLVFVIFFLLICTIQCTAREEYEHPISFLDGDSVRSMYRSFRDFAMRIIGQTGRRTRGTFLQDTDTKFPCNRSNMRSSTVPNSVHRLKPGKLVCYNITFPHDVSNTFYT